MQRHFAGKCLLLWPGRALCPAASPSATRPGSGSHRRRWDVCCARKPVAASRRQPAAAFPRPAGVSSSFLALLTSLLGRRSAPPSNHGRRPATRLPRPCLAALPLSADRARESKIVVRHAPAAGGARATPRKLVIVILAATPHPSLCHGGDRLLSSLASLCGCLSGRPNRPRSTVSPPLCRGLHTLGLSVIQLPGFMRSNSVLHGGEAAKQLSSLMEPSPAAVSL
ncbi:uncharacterized protein V1518DRAFT_456347 [Limtongia smithiae]|uniref:uncharacterized protein n=1 Tax=Limtongia smithiae TaxID=1125753 RepID=UPI0034CEB17F